MGIVSPVGNDLASAWDGIVNGRSGIGPVTHFDCQRLPTTHRRRGARLRRHPLGGPKDAKKMDPFIHYGVLRPR
jgi:3-oxoacyl-[acyl-carrier-protein] synthase II